jgi:hypothetical protein
MACSIALAILVVERFVEIRPLRLHGERSSNVAATRDEDDGNLGLGRR